MQWYLSALPRANVAARHDPDGRALFDGVLPAIGMHTAVCTDIQFHRQEQQIKYRGALADIADALALSAAPGQVPSPPQRCACILYIYRLIKRGPMLQGQATHASSVCCGCCRSNIIVNAYRC